MKIVTGVLHAGKTTMLESSNLMFVRWDDWFSAFVESELGRNRIADIVPSEYLEHASLLKKLLALEPCLLSQVCHALSNDFRTFAQFADCVEVPIYAVDAIKQACDTVIIVATPDYDTLIERIMRVRKCTPARAERMAIQSANELDNLQWEHYVFNENELLRAVQS